MRMKCCSMDTSDSQGALPLLPDDILRHVLLQLPWRQRVLIARLVCQHWRHVASRLVNAVRIRLPADGHATPCAAFPDALSKLVVVLESDTDITDIGDALLAFLERNNSFSAQLTEVQLVCAPDQLKHLSIAALQRAQALCSNLEILSLLHPAPKHHDHTSASSFSPIPADVQLPGRLTALRVQSRHWQPFPWAAVAELKQLMHLQVVAHGPLAPTSAAVLSLAKLPALEHVHLELRPAFVAANAPGVFPGAQQLLCTRLQSLRLQDAQQVSTADLQLMQALKQLRALQLTNLRLQACQPALAQLLQHLTTLTAFSLIGEQDAADGAVAGDLSAALCKLPGLQSLSCSRLSLGSTTSCLEHLTQLEVGASGATNVPSTSPLQPNLARQAPKLLHCSASAKALSPASMAGHQELQHVAWQLASTMRATEAGAFSSMPALETVVLAGQQVPRALLSELHPCVALRALDLSGIAQPLELYEVSQLVARCAVLQQLSLAGCGSAWVTPMVAFVLRAAATLPAKVAKLAPEPEDFERVMQELVGSRVGVAGYVRSEGQEAAGGSRSGGGSSVDWGSEVGGDGADSGSRSDGWPSGSSGLVMEWEEGEVVRFSVLGAGQVRLGAVVYERAAGDEYMMAYSVRLCRAGGKGAVGRGKR